MWTTPGESPSLQASLGVCPHVPIKVFSAPVLCNGTDGPGTEADQAFCQEEAETVWGGGSPLPINSHPGKGDATQTFLDEQTG